VQEVKRVTTALLAAAACYLAVTGSAGAATLGLDVGPAPHYAGWTGPIVLSITPSVDDPPDITYSMYWDGDASSVVLADGSGLCSSNPADTELRCKLDRGAALGVHTLTVKENIGGEIVKSAEISIVSHLSQRVIGVGPTPFYPYRHDGYRDQVNIVFSISKAATAWFQVRNVNGVIIRHSPHRFLPRGRHVMHWGGYNDSGRLVLANHYYWVRVLTTAGSESRIGSWRRVFARRVG
jgi:hypothetical protein